MPLTSCLYETEIWHLRKRPRPYSFRHKHFMLYLALDELDSLNSRLQLFKSQDRALYKFDEADHLPDATSTVSLVDRLRHFALENGIEPESISRISLLTNVRVAGYVFNPVSFFFCTGSDDKPLCCVVEVGNTFGEKKAYLLKADRAEGNKFLGQRQKLFYVSPFTELEQTFDFKLILPDHALELLIDTVEDGVPIVKSGITGRRIELTDSNLWMLTLRYPLATATVIALIHWHALMLWLKRVPYRRKSDDLDKQVDVMRPHSSMNTRNRTGVIVK